MGNNPTELKTGGDLPGRRCPLTRRAAALLTRWQSPPDFYDKGRPGSHRPLKTTIPRGCYSVAVLYSLAKRTARLKRSMPRPGRSIRTTLAAQSAGTNVAARTRSAESRCETFRFTDFGTKRVGDGSEKIKRATVGLWFLVFSVC